ncbi:MAG TPA: inositol monophosphatase [Firmicutes bacterium]|nr:inositol monophosphatase [Bacillota bacterium]
MTYRDVAEQAARVGARILLEHFRELDSAEIQTKQRNDFVSFVDNQSERAIRDVILGAYPHHRFVGEEQGARGSDDATWRWIVDPLDGTSNYVHGVPQFSVSIALEHAGELIASVVLDPIRNDLYSAELGSGAFLNGERIRVADQQSFEDALIGTGFPFRHHEVLDDYLATFREIFPRVAGVRRPGSAAIDFTWVACGFTAGFWEFLLSPWDVAGGALLITEAGGVITDFAGGNDFLTSGNVVAGAPHIHRELLSIVQGVLRDRGVRLS